MPESKRVFKIMTIETWKRRRRGKGRCGERRDKNHARNTQVTVIWKKNEAAKKQEIGVS